MHGAQGSTTGFDWTPNVRTGTSIILVAGDDNGVGSGGSVNTAVGNNPNGDDSCISGNSPSSTPGPAAGAVETGTPNTGSGGSSTNAGAIAGGVVGGLAAIIIIALLMWFFMRRRRHKRQAHQDLDLLPGEGPQIGENRDEFYQPEPFVIPASSRGNSTYDDHTRPSMSDVGRRYSAISTTDASESQYTSALGVGAAGGTRTTASRKSPGGPHVLRPVNVVQHEDAGEVPEAGGSGDGEVETVELPPAYTMVKPRLGGVEGGQAGSGVAGTAGASTTPPVTSTGGATERTE